MSNYTVKGRCKKGNAIAQFSIHPPLAIQKSFSFASIDEAKDAPLAQQLFYLPFVKAVTLEATEIKIERFNILEWEEVLSEVAEQLQKYLNDGGNIISDSLSNKLVPVTVYAEQTPNPTVMKFVANKLLVSEIEEYKSIDDTQNAPLAQALFHFPYVKEIFMDNNYISITKYEVAEWEEITMELREFIRNHIAEGKAIVTETQKTKSETVAAPLIERTETETKIISILEEYIKPAVASDGGNIAFSQYDENSQEVEVVLQGACSGCPSSTITLKNGIENMLKEMMPGQVSSVSAING